MTLFDVDSCTSWFQRPDHHQWGLQRENILLEWKTGDTHHSKWNSEAEGKCRATWREQHTIGRTWRDNNIPCLSLRLVVCFTPLPPSVLCCAPLCLSAPPLFRLLVCNYLSVCPCDSARLNNYFYFALEVLYSQK